MAKLDPGSFEQWISVNQPFPVMPPKSGSTGSFESWITAAIPLPSYAVTTVVDNGAASQTLGSVAVTEAGTVLVAGVSVTGLGPMVQAAGGTARWAPGRISGLALYWVDIEDASSNRYGNGPLRAAGFTVSKLLTASGEFSFDVAGADPNLDRP